MRRDLTTRSIILETRDRLEIAVKKSRLGRGQTDNGTSPPLNAFGQGLKTLCPDERVATDGG